MMTYRLYAQAGDVIQKFATHIALLPQNSECGAPVHQRNTQIAYGTSDPVMPVNGGYIGSGTDKGRVQSAFATVDYFRNFIGTNQSGTTQLGDVVAGDNSTQTRILYSKNGVLKMHVRRIVGGGHATPGPTQFNFITRQILGWKNQDYYGVDYMAEFLGL